MKDLSEQVKKDSDELTRQVNKLGGQTETLKRDSAGYSTAINRLNGESAKIKVQADLFETNINGKVMKQNMDFMELKLK